MSSPLHNLRCFLNLPRQHRRAFLQALLLLPTTALLLRLLGYTRCRSLLSRLPSHPQSMAPQELATMVRIAANHLPISPKCLTRSLTLWSLLKRSGFDATLTLGVAKSSANLHAHAWVEYQGLPLSDPSDIASRFPTLQTP